MIAFVMLCSPEVWCKIPVFGCISFQCKRLVKSCFELVSQAPGTAAASSESDSAAIQNADFMLDGPVRDGQIVAGMLVPHAAVDDSMQMHCQ